MAATAGLPTARPSTTPRATPTLSVQTPPPPREAVLTPTPIVYLVQSGDTLIPIANKFGVSVADIAAVNSGLDPASLQIGQRLVIPGASTNPGASNANPGALLPSPTPLPFEIRGMNVVRTAAGSLECLGEIVNGGGAPITNVQVQITLQDETGMPLQTQSVFVARDVVGAGEASPFRVLFTAPPEHYAKFSVIALRAEAATEARPAKLMVDKLSGVPNGVQFRVTGVLSNTEETPASGIRLVISAYDAEKRLIGYRYVDAQQPTLAPGAAQPIDVAIVTTSQNIASFALQAEGAR